MKPRELAKRLRDLSQPGHPTLLSLEYGVPVPSEGLYLYPDETAMEVRGRRFSAKQGSTVLFECRKSRHMKRSRAGLAVMFALPLGEEHWVVGVGTLIGQRHLDRFPGLTPRVYAL
jgi:hypothetical protein